MGKYMDMKWVTGPFSEYVNVPRIAKYSVNNSRRRRSRRRDRRGVGGVDVEIGKGIGGGVE
jgi:hypothetical protein